MTDNEFKEMMRKRLDRGVEERISDTTALSQIAKFFYMLGQKNPSIPFKEKQEAKDCMFVYEYFFALDIVKNIPEYWEKHYRGDDTDIAYIKRILAKRLETGKHNLL